MALFFMAWKALSLWADTPYPVMVVITDSMAPAFNPGDIMFIRNHHGEVKAGDLPVCLLPNREYPMVHRVIQVLYHREHEDSDIT
jgi:signal peptidase